MHRIYAEIQNAQILKIGYTENYKLKIEELLSSINKDISCMCIANPNSPIGDSLELSELIKILDKTNKLNIPVLIDEAYIEYSSKKSCFSLLKNYENLIISRTFSKGLGCAGLRIGYLIGNTNIMNVVNKLIPCYEVSNISARFGRYLLENYTIIQNYIDLIKKERGKLIHLCKKNNIDYIIGDINSCHIKPNNINEIINYMENQKILYRTRKLPYDNDEWLVLVLYPNLCESELFKKIIETNSKCNNVWKKIFSKINYLEKIKNVNEKTTITELLEINGHLNSKTGSFDLKKWYNLINKINVHLSLNLKNTPSILEIGCGGGALLKYYYDNNCLIYGIDYSEKMISISKKAMKNGKFHVSEAKDLSNIKKNSIDYVLSHSCFQYFPNINYLKKVINEIIRVLTKNGKIYISDVLNKDLKKENINHRIKEIGEERYKKLYKNLNHFYISKNEFINLLEENFKNIKIMNSVIRGTEKKYFRYDIFAELK